MQNEMLKMLKKLEYVDDDGTIWVGLMTASHATKHSTAEVRVYSFIVDTSSEHYHRLAGGEYVGTGGYVGRPKLVQLSGYVPEHVLEGLGKAVKTKGLVALD